MIIFITAPDVMYCKASKHFILTIDFRKRKNRHQYVSEFNEGETVMAGSDLVID